MKTIDREKFATLMLGISDYYQRTLTTAVVELYWRGLERFSYAELERACQLHMDDPATGQYMPKISDLVARIPTPDNASAYPANDEAWGICVKTFDEDDTVIVLDEIMQAREVAQSIMEIGDEVGARLAFRDAYERLVANAEFAGKQPRWWATFGNNRELRSRRVDEAINLGRLPMTARKQIPGPAPDIGDAMRALKLVADRRPEHREEIEKTRGMLAALKDRLETQQTAEDAARRMQRETERLQAEVRREEVAERARKAGGENA